MCRRINLRWLWNRRHLSHACTARLLAPMLCRSPACVACGSAPAITAATLPSYDYAAFTGQAAANDAAPAPLQLIAREDRITPRELQQRCVVWLVAMCTLVLSGLGLIAEAWAVAQACERLRAMHHYAWLACTAPTSPHRSLQAGCPAGRAGAGCAARGAVQHLPPARWGGGCTDA